MPRATRKHSLNGKLKLNAKTAPNAPATPPGGPHTRPRSVYQAVGPMRGAHEATLRPSSQVPRQEPETPSNSTATAPPRSAAVAAPGAAPASKHSPPRWDLTGEKAHPCVVRTRGCPSCPLLPSPCTVAGHDPHVLPGPLLRQQARPRLHVPTAHLRDGAVGHSLQGHHRHTLIRLSQSDRGDQCCAFDIKCNQGVIMTLRVTCEACTAASDAPLVAELSAAITSLSPQRPRSSVASTPRPRKRQL